MGQQQFRLSFSVGTKLLLSVAALLFILIVFLSSSAILLLTNDKEAYTFETKSMEASLAGREFADQVKHVLDTLRLSLAAIDPARPVSPAQNQALQSIVANQTDAAGVVLAKLDPLSGQWAPVAVAGNSGVMRDASLRADQLDLRGDLTPDWARTVIPALQRDGYGFVNLSIFGNPLLGVVLADRGARGAASSLPIAVAIVPSRQFGTDLRDAALTITNREGWILFDTDTASLFSRRSVSGDPLFQAARSSPVSTGSQAFDDNDQHFLGGFAKPGYGLVVLTRTGWQSAMRATYALTEKFILLGCMAIGAGVIFTIFFAKTLTAPINLLYRATEQVSSGNFNLALETPSHDEIGALTESFNVMSIKIQELFKESVEKTILEKELDIASTVQKTLIPPAAYRDGRIEVLSHYQPAARCGGDWWGIFKSGGKLCFGIADATGHGFTSALITASARSCFSVLAKLAAEDPDFTFSPSAMLDVANEVIHQASNGDIMMTFFIGVVDFDAGTLTYANAAHNPPWLFQRREGGFKLVSLTSSGTRLGEKAKLQPIKEAVVPIKAGDIFFMYTDGLTEGKNNAGEMFGKKRVRQVVEAKLPSGPEAIVRAVMEEFMKFSQLKALDDDITVVSARFLSS